MSSIETLRAILVTGAVVAAIVAMITGFWIAAFVLAFAVGVHGVATPVIRRRAVSAEQTGATRPELL